MQTPRQTAPVQALRIARFVGEIAHGRQYELHFSTNPSANSVRTRHRSSSTFDARRILPATTGLSHAPSTAVRTKSSGGKRICRVRDPALDHLATIVRGADTSRHDLSPQCGGLFAISLGLSANFPDDHEMLRHGMVMYDALYTWCRSLQAETHNWPAAKTA